MIRPRPAHTDDMRAGRQLRQRELQFAEFIPGNQRMQQIVALYPDISLPEQTALQTLTETAG